MRKFIKWLLKAMKDNHPSINEQMKADFQKELDKINS